MIERVRTWMDDEASGQARGVVLLIAALMIIPFVDAIAKHLNFTYSPLFVAWARYLAAVLIVVPLAVARLGPRAFPRTGFGAHLLRTAFLVAAMTLHFIAITTIPLATALGAYFISPIIAALLAAFVLGERLTVRRGLAAVLGFVGALLIVRPGGEIEPGTLLAIVGGGLFACYIVATRAAALTAPALATLAFQNVFGALLLTPFAIVWWSWPDAGALLLMLLMGAVSSLSHLLSISAFRHAEASTLAPLYYVEIIGTTSVGYLVFGEFPDAVVWAGTAVIVASGLLVVRERRR